MNSHFLDVFKENYKFYGGLSFLYGLFFMFCMEEGFYGIMFPICVIGTIGCLYVVFEKGRDPDQKGKPEIYCRDTSSWGCQ